MRRTNCRSDEYWMLTQQIRTHVYTNWVRHQWIWSAATRHYCVSWCNRIYSIYVHQCKWSNGRGYLLCTFTWSLPHHCYEHLKDKRKSLTCAFTSAISKLIGRHLPCCFNSMFSFHKYKERQTEKHQKQATEIPWIRSYKHLCTTCPKLTLLWEEAANSAIWCYAYFDT